MYQRYSNPMELLDMMIETQRLSEFVREVEEIRKDELIEETRWEYWLHKDFVRSWPDYLKALNDNNTSAAPTRNDMEDIVKQSFDMLNSFTPMRGGEADGDIQVIGDNRG